MRSKILIAATAIGLMSVNAAAEDIPAPAAAEKCFPAKGIVKFYDKMSGLKPARTDTLEAVMTAAFERDDDAQMLPNFWARSEGVDTPFSVAADGRVTNFHQKLQMLPKTAELCGQVLTKDGETSKIGMNIDNDVLFKNRSGPYSIALEDIEASGADTMMVGGGAFKLMPSRAVFTKNFLIKFRARRTPPKRLAAPKSYFPCFTAALIGIARSMVTGFWYGYCVQARRTQLGGITR